MCSGYSLDEHLVITHKNAVLTANGFEDHREAKPLIYPCRLAARHKIRELQNSGFTFEREPQVLAPCQARGFAWSMQVIQYL